MIINFATLFKVFLCSPILFLSNQDTVPPRRGILWIVFVIKTFFEALCFYADGTFSDTTLAEYCDSLPFLARGTVLKNSAYDYLPLHTGWVMAINHASFVQAALCLSLALQYRLVTSQHTAMVNLGKLHWFLPASWKGFGPFSTLLNYILRSTVCPKIHPTNIVCLWM